MPDVEKSVKMAAKRCHHRMVDDQPKEGGWGIIVVLAGHINMALTMGLQRCCGVLYFSWRNEFETSAQETATVQSLLSAFSCFSVFLGGLLTKRYGSRISGMVGGFLITTGLFCSCWVTDIKQLYVTATVIGVGLGISFNSMIVAVATHFKTRYKTAHAVAYSGMGTGIMALPPLLQLLLEHYGWRGALMIVSAIMANIMACGALYRLPADRKSGLDGRQREQHIAGVSEGDDDELGWNEAVGKELEVEASLGTSEDLLKTLPELEDANGGIEKYTALNEGEKLNSMACLWKKMSSSVGLDVFVKSYRFTLLCLMQTEVNMPYTAFIQFIIPRAESTGVAPSTAAFLISLLGIGGLLGRLGNGLLISWKVSAEGVITACFALASLSSLLPTLDGYAWLAVASFVQGFTIGAFHAIQIVLIRRYVGLSRLVLSTGLCHIIVGIGVLSGPVIAGWLFDVTASYKAVFYVLTGVYVVCTLQMLLIPLLKRLEPGITVQPWDE
ncbi:monocarboxylate transporter 12-B-like [Patiria miniata]|uniref:Major facilitator superfamily (MFS) profile domain-containing protein n=1 Tax=Patiria miniata TaxID=46514 RepID=A0A914B4W5_PATMI|nr:monocarboxylate transporter 12-B-like [Patiria miniata]XP_038050213.1 monocarboxylate transporter 12-B-like [Patiria miniata]XP_038050214.1 monocarboxylate transporter 12-B-like [Patiria miniata]XP_038070843.1 monocarboxylate transporter 12-B-like [Patiria miniata]XP_038070844.1 monocarboxylate transporter 12-B-like [Patiria miniata]